MGIRVLPFILSVLMFAFVAELVRREKLTFKYAFIWLFVSFLGIVCSFFSEWLFALSRLFGFEVPSNFIFFGLISAFVFVSLFLTVFLCQQNRRNDRMAQKIGILESRIRRLEDKPKG